MTICLPHEIPFIKKEKLKSSVEKFKQVAVEIEGIQTFTKSRTGKEMLVASVKTSQVEEIRSYLGLPVSPEQFKPHVTLVERPIGKNVIAWADSYIVKAWC